MQCQHCYVEVKFVQDPDNPDIIYYINSRANRYHYYADDMYCLWPNDTVAHTPLPLDKIDEVIFHGRSGTD